MSDAIDTAADLPERVRKLQEWVQQQDRLEQYKAAYEVWMQKTEWVQDGKFSFNTLGMHRADVMKEEITRLRGMLDRICQAHRSGGNE